MAGGIIQTYMILLAIVSTSQPAAKHGVSPEADKEILQRMKERQVTLEQHQLRLEKEIAELEGREESLAWCWCEAENKMRWHMCTVFSLLVPAVLVIWKQRRNGARGDHGEDTEPGFLGRVCNGVALLTEPFLLLMAICIIVGRAVAVYLPLFVDGLADLALKLVLSRKKKLVLEIP